jgi:organic radical activating enzyme
MSLTNYRDFGRLWRVYGKSAIKYSSPRKILNAMKTEYAYRTRKVDVRSAPYILFVEPLYYCNLDCPLCDRQLFPDARKKSAGRLKMDLFDKILDEVGDYLYQCQIFGQGEPMLDWPLTKQIIQKSHERRIFTLVSSNCTLFTPKNVEDILSCGLDHLVLAIDGLTQKSLEVYRVGAKIEDVMEGMRLVMETHRRIKSKTYVEWQFLVHQHNVHEMEDAKKLAAERGVHIRFAPLGGMEWDESLESFWNPSNQQWKAPAAVPGKAMYDWPCYFLWRSLVLNSNGKVARCLIYQNVAEYADLNKTSVLSAFNHPTVQRARELFQQGAVPDGDFPSPCVNCSYYERHHGGEYLGKRPAVKKVELPVLVGA